MKKHSTIQLLVAFCVMMAIYCIGGDLNPNNTPSPTMRTLDEVYKNIQPGLPSDWKPFAQEQQVTGKSSIHLSLVSDGTDINGSCPLTSLQRENTIVVTGLGHQFNASYDPVSGQSTGQPQHSPIIITKYVDKSSPLIYKALANNETGEATLRFYRTLANGQEELYYTIHLQNTKIVSIKTAFPNIEQVSLFYQTIRWTWEPDGIEYFEEIGGGA